VKRDSAFTASDVEIDIAAQNLIMPDWVGPELKPSVYARMRR
jgi:hypothetical protein